MIQVEQEGTIKVHLICILNGKIKHLQNQAIEIVKFQWTWYGLEDATWEHEDAMRVEYLHLFEDFGNLVNVV